MKEKKSYLLNLEKKKLEELKKKAKEMNLPLSSFIKIKLFDFEK